MTFKKAGVISGAFALAAIGFSLLGGAGAQQVGMRTDAITMTGIFSDDRMTGWFTKNSDAAKEPSWFVFVGGDGSIYKARIESERIAELYRDGARLGDTEAAQYSSATEKFLQNIKLCRELDREEVVLDRRETELEGEEDELDLERDKLERKIERFDRLAEKSDVDLKTERAQLEKAQKLIDEAERELEKRAAELDAAQDKLDARRDILDADMDRLLRVLDAIIADLRSDKIITGKNGLSFKLSNQQFVVNGKPLRGEIYERYRQKYIVDSAAESGFVYNWKGKL